MFWLAFLVSGRSVAFCLSLQECRMTC
jgi:hypothetical protein